MALPQLGHGPPALVRKLMSRAKLLVMVPTQLAVLQLYQRCHDRDATVSDLDPSASGIRIEVLDHLSPLRRWALRMWLGGVHKWRSEFAQFDYHIVAQIDGRRVGYVGIVDRTASIDGSPVRAGLVGGVFIDPRLRNQGLATRLIERARDVMVDLGMKYGILMCNSFLVPFYERFGWSVADGPLIFDRGWGPQTSPWRTMVLPLQSDDIPSGTINLNGLPA